MKNFVDWLDDNWVMLLAILGYSIGYSLILWFVYKVASGFYHLLDKLIDKI